MAQVNVQFVLGMEVVGHNDPAPNVDRSFNVSKADQAISNFISTPSSGRVGEFAVVSATGGGSTNPVSFTTTTPSLCSITGSDVSLLAAGTCTIAADQAEDANYNAAPTVNLSIIISKADQAISNFISTPNSGRLGEFTVVSATGGGSTNPVSFTTTTPSLCSITGSDVSLLAAGTCTIAADQAEDANYNGGTHSQSKYYH